MILGLTGFSGSGKSTVAHLLEQHGFYHLDCDRVVHDEVYKDPAVLRALDSAFGPVAKDGVLDRAALRRCTMGNPLAMKKLNETVMPFIMETLLNKLELHRNDSVIVDAPLLFESGLNRYCSKVLSVIASPEVALSRIMERDSLSREDAEKRLNSMHPAAYYVEKSDYIIDNSADLSALERAVEELISKLHDQA